jgi:hypothetical protein
VSVATPPLTVERDLDMLEVSIARTQNVHLFACVTVILMSSDKNYEAT